VQKKQKEIERALEQLAISVRLAEREQPTLSTTLR
jgi:hypothetical protein